MSFNTSLSGLNAAQADLSTTSNNIANVSTVGFKKSRSEFADIYAVSAFGSSSTAIGSGVLLSNVAQQFKQGNLEFTDNTLDMAISGQGFFVLGNSLSDSNTVYSRAGNFSVNSQGYVVNNSGQYLQSFPVNSDGTVRSTSLSAVGAVRLPTSAGTPSATTTVDIGVNLSADETGLDPSNFDPNDPATYNSSTSVTVYDSLGQSHVSTYYFVKDDGSNAAPAAAAAAGGAVGDGGSGDAAVAALGGLAGNAVGTLGDGSSGTNAIITASASNNAETTLQTIATTAGGTAGDGGVGDAAIAAAVVSGLPAGSSALTAIQAIATNAGGAAGDAGVGDAAIAAAAISGAQTMDAAAAGTDAGSAASAANQWAVYQYIDDVQVTIPNGVDNPNITTDVNGDGTAEPDYALLRFDASGIYQATIPSTLQWSSLSASYLGLTAGSVDNLQITSDFGNNSPTQLAGAFSVTSLSQDGYTTGRLDGLEVTDTGIIRANYTNGNSVALGKIAMVDFSNTQGLRQQGNTSWASSIDSGDPLAGEAGTGSLGLIQSGAVESSNVDLTQELVKLITAQRNYQANAKAIETATTVTQTILNMR